MSSIDGTWRVEVLAIGGELNPPLDGTSLTLEFEHDRVGGDSGINRFMGALNEEPPPLFGPLASTMMAGPPDEMAQEQIYLKLLRSAASYEIQEEEMRLVARGLVTVVLARTGTTQT